MIQLTESNWSGSQANSRSRGEGGGINTGLNGETPVERGAFIRFQVYDRVGISKVKLHGRVRKSSISVCYG